jgi:hypothetical protein
VPVVELDLELRIRQRIDDGPVHLDGVVLGHDEMVTGAGATLSRSAGGCGLAVGTSCRAPGATLGLEAV